jgi:rubredoxin
MIDCSMCGHSFTREEGAACRSGCPMAGCGMVTCPSCGFEFPPESKLVTLVASLLRRRGPRVADSASPALAGARAVAR